MPKVQQSQYKSLDRIDRKILKALQRDGRLSNTALAKFWHPAASVTGMKTLLMRLLEMLIGFLHHPQGATTPFSHNPISSGWSGESSTLLNLRLAVHRVRIEVAYGNMVAPPRVGGLHHRYTRIAA